MFFSPLEYDQPLFRPPSEANSLIIQVTYGCSWNKCSFCEMYTSKKFSIKPFADVERDIERASRYYKNVKKVFLADGNALVLSFDKMNQILKCIREKFPNLARISAYASPRDLANKSAEELQILKENGLKLLYVGIETGDDELLKIINKGESFTSIKDNLVKTRKAGIKLSVMILTGLGGKIFSEQHAVESARVVNEVQPEFLSTLVLSFPYGIDHFKNRFNGEYVEMDSKELLKELYGFIDQTKLKKVIFRSDHASNYLVLKGILDRDKQTFLDKIDYAIRNPDKNVLRAEWQRGL